MSLYFTPPNYGLGVILGRLPKKYTFLGYFYSAMAVCDSNKLVSSSQLCQYLYYDYLNMFFPEPKIFGSADGWPAGRRRRAVRREVLAGSTDWRHRPQRPSWRSVSTKPNDRQATRSGAGQAKAERECGVTSAGWAARDSVSRVDQALCDRPGTGRVRRWPAGAWTGQPGSQKRRGDTQIRSTARRSAGSEKLVRPLTARAGGTRRRTLGNRRMSGPATW